MNLKDYFRLQLSNCRELTWLLIVLAFTGMLCIVWQIIASFFGINPGVADQWLALSSDFSTAITRPWTFITYMCLHYSLLHLIFNLLWLFWFGTMLMEYRSGKMLLYIFAGGGLAGGLAYIIAALAGATSGAYLTGDSAGVLSVMAACGVLMPDRKIRLFILGDVKLKWLALGCILLTLAGSGGSGYAVQIAHLAGALTGAVTAVGKKRGFHLNFTALTNKFAPKSVNTTNRHASHIAAAMQRLDDHRRLDELLDKIRLSGYNSLSEREKTELNHISSRIPTRTTK